MGHGRELTVKFDIIVGDTYPFLINKLKNQRIEGNLVAETEVVGMMVNRTATSVKRKILEIVPYLSWESVALSEELKIIDENRRELTETSDTRNTKKLNLQFSNIRGSEKRSKRYPGTRIC